MCIKNELYIEYNIIYPNIIPSTTSDGNDCCMKPAHRCRGRYATGSCCTTSAKCGEGEGDCDSNAECGKGLVCGTDNCDYSLGFYQGYDCCTKP